MKKQLKEVLEFQALRSELLMVRETVNNFANVSELSQIEVFDSQNIMAIEKFKGSDHEEISPRSTRSSTSSEFTFENFKEDGKYPDDKPNTDDHSPSVPSSTRSFPFGKPLIIIFAFVTIIIARIYY